MNGPAEALEVLVGRQATDAEREKLYKIRDALGIKNNDALWTILLALDHYQRIYEKVPSVIKETAQVVTADIRKTAAEQMKVAAEETKRDLAKAVSEVAQQVAIKTAGTRMLQWALACTAVVAVVLVVVGWLGYSAGRKGGIADGYQVATSEQARASWANTPEGQLAYDLAQTGSIRELATCSGRGWKQEKGFCYVQAQNGKIYGWALPKGQ